MNKFKTINGSVIPDVIDYIKNYINENENVELLIGSDSQSYGNIKTIYGVVIVLYRKGNGAHIICTKELTKIENNLSVRLLNEVYKSIEVAEYLKYNGITQIKNIDIDINPDKKFKSNKVFKQAVGLVEGMGYNVRYKNNGAIVTYAANHIVRL